MTRSEPSIKNVINSLIPITRFNRGEANKIFDEVSENGVKIVLKNNSPISVLMSPTRYDEMLDALEDYALFFEAEKRVSVSDGKYLSSDDVMSNLGISASDLDEVEVEIE